MKRVQLLDYGRFAASLSVMAFHYTYNGIRNGKISSIDHLPPVSSFTKYGHLGVEFFFMISGYVIFYSAQNKKASQFALSRFKRLFPSFWFAVLFTSFFALTWGKGTDMEVTPKQILANLTMLPGVFGQKNVDGVYWTLVWELKFYLLVFLTLLIGPPNYLNNLFIFWSYYLLFAFLFKLDLPFSDHNYIFFAAGSLFAMSKNNLTAKILIPLIICFFLNIFYTNTIIVVFYLFFLILNSERGSKLVLFKSSLLGALTYPVYLIHAHFGYLFLSKFANQNNKMIVYPILVILVFIIAYFIDICIEKKLSKFWTAFFSKTVEFPVTILERIINLIGMRFKKSSALSESRNSDQTIK
jgi:peptidoglycan/LPS O-acetylase OafA/YrhL